jgi:hypothetical protein
MKKPPKIGDEEGYAWLSILSIAAMTEFKRRFWAP